MSSEIVRFGKYKDKPVDAMLDDRPYIEWLLAQSWFKEKYGNVYNIVINNGAEPSETPEHNAMQIKFLDEEYRLKFAYFCNPEIFRIITAEGFVNYNTEVRSVMDQVLAEIRTRNAASRQFYDNKVAEYEKEKADFAAGLRKYEPHFGYSLHQEDDNRPDIEIKGLYLDQTGRRGRSDLTLSVTTPNFEANGVDVAFTLYTGFDISPSRIKNGRNGYLTDAYVDLPIASSKVSFSIEIKPTIGDDYPAVLRQVLRSGATTIVVRSYSGVGATESQFCDFFKSQGVRIVFERDIDRQVLPEIFTTLTALRGSVQ